MPDRVNQQAIADRLQISRTTVSRCFTNHPGINPVTRSRVFELAAALGYQHMESRSGKKPASTRRRRFGVLICSTTEEFQTGYESPGLKLVAGVSEYAQLSNRPMDVHYADPKAKSLDEETYHEIQPLRSKKWGGAILVYPFPTEVVDDLHLMMPTVSLAGQYGSSPINFVDVDHFLGISLLLDRLTALGHRRIGFFTRPYEVEANWSMRRYAAFVEKMARLELGVDPADVINVHPQIHPSLDRAHAATEARTRAGVTAWICAADHQAYDLIQHLQARKLKVPADVSVTGFDGIQKPDWAPWLTTAQIDGRGTRWRCHHPGMGRHGRKHRPESGGRRRKSPPGLPRSAGFSKRPQRRRSRPIRTGSLPPLRLRPRRKRRCQRGKPVFPRGGLSHPWERQISPRRHR